MIRVFRFLFKNWYDESQKLLRNSDRNDFTAGSSSHDVIFKMQSCIDTVQKTVNAKIKVTVLLLSSLHLYVDSMERKVAPCRLIRSDNYCRFMIDSEAMQLSVYVQRSTFN